MPSSVVSNFYYKPENNILRVTFVSGNIYDYKNVPEIKYMAMKKSVSKGIYFNRHIKGKYAFNKVE